MSGRNPAAASIYADMSNALAYNGVIFDLDGTIYLGDDLLKGAQSLVSALRERGCQVLFVSNKPLVPSSSYAEKLSRLGIPTNSEDVLNSTNVLIDWLHNELPSATLMVLGEKPLIEEFQAAGFDVTTSAEQADVVVAAFDRTFTYEKWVQAFNAIRGGARFVATNPDVTCPIDGGEIPDCGGIIAALEATTGRKVEFVAGKPSPQMIDTGLRRLGVPRTLALVVGDRPETDIAMGVAAGVDTALVLTGVANRADHASWPAAPTRVVADLVELADILLAGGRLSD